MSKGTDTRTRILDVAQDSVLAKGFGATSIDEIIAATGITKSGFFYHFRDKNALAKAMLNRYVAEDERVYDDVFGRAHALVDDPLQAFLLGLKLLSEIFADLPNGHPGCLVAISCLADRGFDREVQDIGKQAVLIWRRRFHGMIQDIAAVYPPRETVDIDQLADMVSTVFEGGIIMSKALKNPEVLVQQTLVLRTFVKMLFDPNAKARPLANPQTTH